LHDGDQCPLGRLARLQEGRKVTALAQLRNPQLQRAQACLQRAIAEPVAMRGAVLAALVPPGADHAFDLELHQPLQHRFRQLLEKIAAAALLQQLQQWHRVVGHRVHLRSVVEPQHLNLTEDTR
jgi:hypothetical protein